MWKNWNLFKRRTEDNSNVAVSQDVTTDGKENTSDVRTCDVGGNQGDHNNQFGESNSSRDVSLNNCGFSQVNGYNNGGGNHCVKASSQQESGHSLPGGRASDHVNGQSKSLHTQQPQRNSMKRPVASPFTQTDSSNLPRNASEAGRNNSMNQSFSGVYGPLLSSPIVPKVRRALESSTGLRSPQTSLLSRGQPVGRSSSLNYGFGNPVKSTAGKVPWVRLKRKESLTLTDIANGTTPQSPNTVKLAAPEQKCLPAAPSFKMTPVIVTTEHSRARVVDTQAVVSALREKRKRFGGGPRDDLFSEESWLNAAKRRRQDSSQSNASSVSIPSMPESLPDLMGTPGVSLLHIENLKDQRPSTVPAMDAFVSRHQREFGLGGDLLGQSPQLQVYHQPPPPLQELPDGTNKQNNKTVLRSIQSSLSSSIRARTNLAILQNSGLDLTRIRQVPDGRDVPRRLAVNFDEPFEDQSSANKQPKIMMSTPVIATPNKTTSVVADKSTTRDSAPKSMTPVSTQRQKIAEGVVLKKQNLSINSTSTPVRSKQVAPLNMLISTNDIEQDRQKEYKRRVLDLLDEEESVDRPGVSSAPSISIITAPTTTSVPTTTTSLGLPVNITAASSAATAAAVSASLDSLNKLVQSATAGSGLSSLTATSASVATSSTSSLAQGLQPPGGLSLTSSASSAVSKEVSLGFSTAPQPASSELSTTTSLSTAGFQFGATSLTSAASSVGSTQSTPAGTAGGFQISFPPSSFSVAAASTGASSPSAASLGNGQQASNGGLSFSLESISGSQPNTGFGSTSSSRPSTGFGSSTSSSQPSTGFGSSTSSSQPSTGFGSSTSSSQPSTGFGSSTSSSQPSTGFGSSTSSSQPSTGFGSTSSSQPSTGFGSSTSSSQPSTGIFGSASSSQPSTGIFGSAMGTQPSTNSGFNFGSLPASQTSSSVGGPTMNGVPPTTMLSSASGMNQLNGAAQNPDLSFKAPSAQTSTGNAQMSLSSGGIFGSGNAQSASSSAPFSLSSTLQAFAASQSNNNSPFTKQTNNTLGQGFALNATPLSTAAAPFSTSASVAQSTSTPGLFNFGAPNTIAPSGAAPSAAGFDFGSSVSKPQGTATVMTSSFAPGSSSTAGGNTASAFGFNFGGSATTMAPQQPSGLTFGATPASSLPAASSLSSQGFTGQSGFTGFGLNSQNNAGTSGLTSGEQQPQNVFTSAPASQPFGSAGASLFGSSSQGSSTAHQHFGASSTAPGVSMFGAAAAAPGVSMFGAAATSTTTTTNTNTGLFNFGQTSAPAASTSSVAFGPSSTNASLSKPFAFGAASTQPGPGFGGVTTTSNSVFGSIVSPTSSAGTTSYFGSGTTSAFGTGSVTSPFGQSAQATSAPIFGSSAATTSASMFGSMVPTTVPSAFGSAISSPMFPAANSQTSSMFGAAAPPGGQPASTFGAPASSSNQLFTFGAAGGSQPAPAFGSSSGGAFGGAAAAGPSLFGAKPAAPSYSAATANPASMFGAPVQSPSSAPSYSAATANPASMFGAPVQSPSSAPSSAFGSSFGVPNNTFGAQSNTDKPAFGAISSGFGNSAVSTFGAAPQNSVFGASSQNSASNLFGSAAQNPPPAFGSQPGSSQGVASSPFGGGGGVNAFGAAKPNPFGATATSQANYNFASTQSNMFSTQPANSGFNFNQPNTQPAASNTGFNFGAQTPTRPTLPAPAPGGFNFGATAGGPAPPAFNFSATPNTPNPFTPQTPGAVPRPRAAARRATRRGGTRR